VSAAPQPQPYTKSLAESLAAHAALLSILLFLPRLLSLVSQTPPPGLEIEITSPYLGDGPAKLGAPKPLTPGVPALINATAALPPVQAKTAVPVKPPEPVKDWVLPGPETKKLQKDDAPAATGAENGAGTATTPGGAQGGTGTAAKTGGSGEGADDGVPGGRGHGGTPLLAFPKLLNRDEVMANLRRFYPDAERRANREGDVLAVIHIDAEGTVGSVDIRASASSAFDEAARKVGKLMRFSPAIGLNGRPVAVRLPQTIQFRLTE
jgi:TonB family protein